MFIYKIRCKLQKPSHPGVLKCAKYNSGIKKMMKGMLQSNLAVPEQSPSSWIQYTQTVCHRYLFFLYLQHARFFSACSPGLVYLWPSDLAVP